MLAHKTCVDHRNFAYILPPKPSLISNDIRKLKITELITIIAIHVKNYVVFTFVTCIRIVVHQK